MVIRLHENVVINSCAQINLCKLLFKEQEWYLPVVYLVHLVLCCLQMIRRYCCALAALISTIFHCMAENVLAELFQS